MKTAGTQSEPAALCQEDAPTWSTGTHHTAIASVKLSIVASVETFAEFPRALVLGFLK
jgi:hypothetical protein